MSIDCVYCNTVFERPSILFLRCAHGQYQLLHQRNHRGRPRSSNRSKCLGVTAVKVRMTSDAGTLTCRVVGIDRQYCPVQRLPKSLSWPAAAMEAPIAVAMREFPIGVGGVRAALAPHPGSYPWLRVQRGTVLRGSASSGSPVSGTPHTQTHAV